MGGDTNNKFHLTITDNQTGEVMRDLDIVALAGAIHTGEDGIAQGIFLGRCNRLTTAETVKGAEYTLERVYKEDPLLHLLTAMMDGEEANK